MLDRLRPWIVFGIGAFLAGQAAYGYAVLIRRLDDRDFDLRYIVVEILVRVLIPVLGGVVALWLDRQPGLPRAASFFGRPARLGLASILALGYLLTFSLGVPSVISRATNEEAARYQETAARDPERFSQLPPPRFDTFFAMPVAPGVIVVYRETWLDVQNGWGGWVFYAWWGSGSKELRRVSRWIS